MEMPDLPTSSTDKKTQFSNLLIPFFILLSSLILSHPVCFLKLLSFLSPLLITTFFILLFTSHRTVLKKLRGNGAGEKVELELHCSEDSAEENEVYKIFFQASQVEDDVREPPESVDKFLIWGDSWAGECLRKNLGEKNNNENNNNGDARAEKTLADLFLENKDDEECEAVDLLVVEETEVKEIKEVETQARIRDSESNTAECDSRAWSSSRRQRLSNSMKMFESSGGLREENLGLCLGGFGSMRQTEKEWKRTLACKLFEDRHGNSDSNIGHGQRDEEGMDLLWETYERNESSTSIPESSYDKKAVKESKTTRKMELQKEEEEEEEEDGDEEEMSKRLCCLEALKMSVGKVNLGMGRPNFAKISKALRGIGWLHHVKARKGRH